LLHDHSYALNIIGNRTFTNANPMPIKKAEPKTPHFLSLNQDIVAWSQEAESYLAILSSDLKVQTSQQFSLSCGDVYPPWANIAFV
jgi:hypothetical protein